jgi:hypothetical protein
MIQSINNVVTKVGSTVSKASKAILATAAMAGLGYASNAFAAPADVTAMSTTFTAGSTTTVTGVSGYGDSSTGFLSTNNYTIKYLGGDLAVSTVTANGQTYTATANGQAVVRRNLTDGNPNNDILWYATQGTADPKNGSTITLEGPQESGYNAALSQNNLFVGADNIFGNKGNGHGNNTDVERVDLLYSSGITTDSTKIFTIFDRGLTGQHDGFKIAAITALGAGNVPSAYGPVLTLNQGAWGNTSLLPLDGYTIMRKNNTLVNDKFHPSDTTLQTIGGVAINTTDLEPAGTTIYGYSLFAPDVTGTGAQLVDWTNTTFFPTNSNSSATGTAGLDPEAGAGVLFTCIPEPSTATLMTVVAGALLTRRSKRRQQQSQVA